MARISSPNVWKEHLAEQMKDPEFAEAYEAFGKELRLAIALAQAREARNMTQRDLAALTGIKQPMIARIEKGQSPSLTTLAKIAAALNASVNISPTGVTSVTLA